MKNLKMNLVKVFEKCQKRLDDKLSKYKNLLKEVNDESIK